MNNEVFFSKCYEKHNFVELNNIDISTLINILSFHLKLFPENKVFFDVGSNAGSFIKALSNFNIYNDIHCFEPHPIISKNTKQIYNYVKMNDFCLSNTDGIIDMNYPMWSVGLSSIIKRPIFDNLGTEIKVVKTKSQKLDTYCFENNINYIDFIKIDVEGAEKLIFEGALNLLEQKKIKAGVFEIGETLKDANTSETEIESLLINYGYIINKNLSNNDWYFYLDNKIFMI